MRPPAPGLPRLRRCSVLDSPVRVLLLHGLGCTTSMWDAFVEHSPDRFEFWDVMLPWHGVGDGAWSHHEDAASAVVDVVAAGAAGAEFDAVVAHSFAATLLTEAFAARRVAARPAVLTSVFYRASPGDFDWPTISYYLNDFHLIFSEALRFGKAARFPQKYRHTLAESVRDQVGAYGWMRFFECYLRTPFLDLSAIGAPQLVLTGDADIATRPADGRALAAALPRGRFELIPGCGHFPMLERPERLAVVVSDFLDTVLRRDRPRAATDDPCLELT